MAEDKRNFIRGIMDKSTDERLVQDGTYIDALNIRVSSEENDDNHVENPLGNTKITSVIYDGIELTGATTIGSFADTTNNTIYWFLTKAATVDMILSYNVVTSVLSYHIVDANGILNFATDRLINDINKIGDLLFWTQEGNAPRYINITRAYSSTITEDDINVIVAPPLDSPSISLLQLPTQENYIEDRFVCFAYRYNYVDDQYSALSQFSNPAFSPGAFVLDGETYQNAGMKNEYNGVAVTFDTGGSNVKGIELCFKLSDSNVINVIGKYSKRGNGWSDNQQRTLGFSNRKIYTTLPESELLRLYDNVPRFALAQTIMGNRLFYGNYTDGYDIVDENGRDIQIDYACDVVSLNDQVEILTTTLGNGTYTFGIPATIISDTVLLINMAPAVTAGLLVEGSLFSFTITIQHSQFATFPSVSPPSQQGPLELTFLFNLKQDYASVALMIASEDFNVTIGTSSSYVALASVACSSFSFADIFNCAISDIAGYDKETSGITSNQQGFAVLSSGNVMSVQIPAMKFEETGAGTGIIYEYFEIVSATSSFSKTSTPNSLHSNRDYDIGIVYEDDYARSTTALTAIDNSVYIPANASTTQNSIQVTINNKAPAWATRYKFVAKSSKLGYETIYSAIYYTEEQGNRVWLKIDGDNLNKISEGDILILKADSSGPTNRVIQKKILEIKTQAADFISGGVSELAGTYMLMNSTELDVSPVDNAIIDYGNISTGIGEVLLYPINISTTPYTIPAGSIIRFVISFDRDNGIECPGQSYYLDVSYTAKIEYTNLYNFVIGENIDFSGGISEGSIAVTTFNSTLISAGSDPTVFTFPIIEGVNQIQFAENTATNEMYLCLRPGVLNCIKVSKRSSRVSCQIIAQRAVNLVVFETIPLESDADLFYEESRSYAITNYNHQGNSQNQDYATGVPAVVDLAFFDCYTFGNGVESYKSLDALTGRYFSLGNRFYSVAQQDYKQADRLASITYSGKYNQETNLNKLNEFNLGLVNYDDLDILFGSIQKMFGRQTDINVLQEDKISYILAGKNLISDAAAGGAITTSPEVLGTQIARLEQFGISQNPESFAVYGSKRFFTDSKRGVVIMLEGSNNQESLVPISSVLMTQYFRTLFANNVSNYKLGGYDPYNSEYVLSFGDSGQAVDAITYPCGITISAQGVTTDQSYTIDLGDRLGQSTYTLTVTSGTAFMRVVYDGTTVNSGTASAGSPQTIVVVRNNASIDTATLTIFHQTGDVAFTVSAPCPNPKRLKLVKVVAIAGTDLDKFTHIKNNWEQDGVISPFDSVLVDMDTIPNSYYDLTDGEESVGSVPPSGATVTMKLETLQGDDFVFDDTQNKFMYLATDTLYGDNEADVNSLIAAASTATPIENPNPGTYYATFTSNTAIYDYLYLIWNLKKATTVDLCYDATNIDTVCEC